ncbi:uncharacterized protein [Argopecten irradians]|uniref:uncharacterized protein n=1 Tax=Argopecten irradians TaxID=31199 RepID=UPI0037205F6E
MHAANMMLVTGFVYVGLLVGFYYLPGRWTDIQTIPHQCNASKYIVYDCRNDQLGNCGQWPERISGMLHAYIVSLLLNRTFALNHEPPCKSDLYSDPTQPRLKWRPLKHYCDYKMDLKDSFYDLIDHKAYKSSISTLNLQSFFNTTVSFIRVVSDDMELFKKRNHADRLVPFLKLPEADVYRQFYRAVTRDVFPNNISRNLKLRKDKTLICVDLNTEMFGTTGDNINRNALYSSLSKFLKQFNTELYNIYVSTDSPGIKTFFRIKFRDNFSDFPLRMINRTYYQLNKLSCEVFQRSIQELQLLATCGILVISKSNFGKLSAYVRTSSDNLYCLSPQTGVVPCTRYNLTSVLNLRL